MAATLATSRTRAPSLPLPELRLAGDEPAPKLRRRVATLAIQPLETTIRRSRRPESVPRPSSALLPTLAAPSIRVNHSVLRDVSEIPMLSLIIRYRSDAISFTLTLARMTCPPTASSAEQRRRIVGIRRRKRAFAIVETSAPNIRRAEGISVTYDFCVGCGMIRSNGNCGSRDAVSLVQGVLKGASLGRDASSRSCEQRRMDARNVRSR